MCPYPLPSPRYSSERQKRSPRALLLPPADPSLCHPESTRPDWAGAKAEELADVITQIGMAYVWVNIANDSEPDIERATRAMRLLVAAADAETRPG